MIIRKTEDFDAFRCIASACPDSCCRLWDVEVDETSYQKYLSIPGDLGEKLREHLTPCEGGAVFEAVNNRCPMWQADGLCEIQCKVGEDYLCNTCRDFPRLTHDYGDFVELGLELSCPQAAEMLLSHFPADRISESGETGESDYDAGEMELLQSTRQTALEILHRNAPREALIFLLLYGYRVQEAFDGNALEPISVSDAVELAETFRGHGNIGDIVSFYQGLEILTQDWKDRLNSFHTPSLHQNVLFLADYFVRRYWLQAISDGDLICRVKFIVTSCLLIASLDGDFTRTAQLYSKEIENCPENMDALLDAAYDCPAITDDKLLGLLLS